MTEFTVTYLPALTEAEQAAAEQAAVERHRTFLRTCINAYSDAYGKFFDDDVTYRNQNGYLVQKEAALAKDDMLAFLADGKLATGEEVQAHAVGLGYSTVAGTAAGHLLVAAGVARIIKNEHGELCVALVGWETNHAA